MLSIAIDPVLIHSFQTEMRAEKIGTSGATGEWRDGPGDLPWFTRLPEWRAQHDAAATTIYLIHARISKRRPDYHDSIPFSPPP